MKRENITRRLATLHEIITRPTTGDGERCAAQAMHDRLTARLATLAQDPAAAPRYETGFVGNRYAPGRTLTEIARLIRADIKAARALGKRLVGDDTGAMATVDPIAAMPANAKISVAQRRGGSALDITITGLSADWWDTTTYTADVPFGPTPGNYRRVTQDKHEPTARLKALTRAIQETASAYRYDRSDASTDLFLYNYVVFVRAVRP